MPATTRALGINSNLVRPELPGTLTLQVAKAVAEHNGPLWGMENPQAYSGWADTALTARHLARGDCSMLQSNIEVGPIVKICRLHRL
jgi:hypothetical protein